jgi:chemotaxis protein CheY-P-specific phosphatase CheC
MSALQNAVTQATYGAVQSLGAFIGGELPFVLRDVEIENFAVSHFSAQNFGIVQLESSGLINAEISLLIDSDSVSQILQKMLGAEADADMIQECESDAMCELGNIMINSYLSSIADFLHAPFESTLPTYHVESKDEFLKNIDTEKRFVMSHIDLQIAQYTAEMKLLFSMNHESFENLLQKLH